MKITKAQICTYWEFIQAIKDGKTVQMYTIEGWVDLDNEFNFFLLPEFYRVKKEPVIVRKWANVYDDGTHGSWHTSQRAADKAARHVTTVGQLIKTFKDGVFEHIEYVKKGNNHE